MKFTVFTPSHNRAYTLRRLYDSLCAQTKKDFEWLIVDDGSTDDTERLCASFAGEGFPVRYFRKANGGKCAAVNFAARKAEGKWFYIVDSDDWLPPTAMEEFEKEERRIAAGERVAVLCGMRHCPNGRRIGGDLSFGSIECSCFLFRYTMEVKGDLAEAVRTDVLRKFPFPEFEGEKFCPEAVLFNRLGRQYLTRYFNAHVYTCEYLPDGLTAHIVQVRMQSPKSTLLCYAEQALCPVPFRVKLRSWVNFWRFAPCLSEADAEYPKRFAIPLWARALRPLGLLFHKRDTAAGMRK